MIFDQKEFFFFGNLLIIIREESVLAKCKIESVIDRCRQLLQSEKKAISQLFKLTEIFGNLVGLITTIFLGDITVSKDSNFAVFYSEMVQFIEAKCDIKVRGLISYRKGNRKLFSYTRLPFGRCFYILFDCGRPKSND